MIQRYQTDELDEFLQVLSAAALDEARAICLELDARAVPVAAFVREYTNRLPKRIQLVFVCDARTTLSEPFLAAISYLESRSEKVNVHFASGKNKPVFVGSAGVYGFEPHAFEQFTRSRNIACVTSQVTILLDLGRLENAPAHEIRSAILNSARTVYALAQQQRFSTAMNGTEVLAQSASELYMAAHGYVRVWNYDWEKHHALLASVHEDLERLARNQESIYRACNLPYSCRVKLSSSFAKADKRLTPRQYRKWMVTHSHDLHTDQYERYIAQRRAFCALFSGIDRFRVFRAGNPTPQQVARELLELEQFGLPLVTIDFKPLRGVRRLTEYFT
jgi:hypothetical protein